jgi:hypothetical protein
MTPDAADRATQNKEDRYRKAVVIFDALRDVVVHLNEQKAWVRASARVSPRLQREMQGPSGDIVLVNRDRAVCALVNKACNTHTAIRVLTDAGHGDDAMALGRVLIENVGLLQWLLLDPVFRLDLFCLSDALNQRHWGTLIETHFQENARLLADAKRSITEEVQTVAGVFGDTEHKWAQIVSPDGTLQHVNFKGMMQEIAVSGGSSSNFRYEVIYFLHSAFVHTTASSMRSFMTVRDQRYFRFDLGANEHWLATALAGANISALLALQCAAEHIGASAVQVELEEIFSRMKPSAMQPST